MKSMKILPAAISVIAYATTSSSTTGATVTTSVVGVEATAVPREESSSTQVLQCREEEEEDDDDVTAVVMEEVSVDLPTHQPLQASTSTTTTSTTSTGTHGATTGTTSTDATTTTIQASVSLLLPQHPLEYYHQQWSPYPFLVRLFQYFWGRSSPSSSFLSSSSSRTHPKKTRCLQFNHHHHHRDVKVTVSPVCHDDRHRDNDHTDTTCSSSSSSSSVHHEEDAQNEFCYELSEPLHLELGGRLFKHVEDYAYRPVVVTSSSSVPLVPNDNDESKLPPPPPRRPDPANNMDHEEEDDDDDGSLEESPVLPRRGWWQWWIPWQILRDQSFSKFHHSSSYRMQDEAFAGGSHGEIWRGRRICAATKTTLERNCTEETLIFKRLKVEKGFRALEAGLREIHFGSLLRQLPSDSSAMFTQYVEHFFGNNGELWIVFKDHGLSLRSFLYTSVDAGGFVVFQQSWLWTLMRISIHSQRASTAESSHTNANHDDWSRPAEETAIEVTQQASPATNTDVGRNLIRTLLQQVHEWFVKREYTHSKVLHSLVTLFLW